MKQDWVDIALYLKVVHVMHRKTNRFNMDLFVECCEWKGDIINPEPEKCAALAFFPLTELPYKYD